MNGIYQDFKERFGMEGVAIIGACTLTFAGLGFIIGTAVALNIKPAIIVIEPINKEGK